MRLERFCRALRKERDDVRAFERGKQDACVLLNDTQRRIAVPARTVGRERVEVELSRLVPCTAAVAVDRLHGGVERQERALGALFHHVVEAVGPAVRQALDEGVLLCQRREEFFRVFVSRDKFCHFHGEFVGKPHDG